jgi:hypothetical protein
MKTIQYVWSGYWGMVFFGLRDICNKSPLLWLGIACYLFSGLIVYNAFNLNSGAFSLPDNIKHQIMVIMVAFALYCLYLGGYLIYKSKRQG